MARNRRVIAGRAAMITGAASGIGRSLALRLSRSGSPVAIADVDDAGLKDTARLVGPDAYVFDALARVAPTHYYDVMARFEKRLRTRASQRAAVPSGLHPRAKGVPAPTGQYLSPRTHPRGDGGATREGGALKAARRRAGRQSERG